jgi:hypothetical protein
MSEVRLREGCAWKWEFIRRRDLFFWEDDLQNNLELLDSFQGWREMMFGSGAQMRGDFSQ